MPMLRLALFSLSLQGETGPFEWSVLWEYRLEKD